MASDRGAPEGSALASSIQCHRDLRAYFHETLTRALASSGVEAPPPTEHYLVGLLSVLGHDTAALSRSLVELELDANEAPREGRVQRLRNLGDQALSVSGLFDAHLERHGISRAYVVEVGARAYGAAGRLAGGSRRERDRVFADVFSDLSCRFHTYAQVLEHVRENTALATPDDVLSLYERYQRSHSPALAERLASHGVYWVPEPAAGDDAVS